MSGNNNNEQQQGQGQPPISHKEAQRRLINALSRFKPSDATPVQFYNCIREMCIMYNCGLEDGLRKAIVSWPDISVGMRDLCKSEELAELPIPPIIIQTRTDLRRVRIAPSSTDSSSPDEDERNEDPKPEQA